MARSKPKAMSDRMDGYFVATAEGESEDVALQDVSEVVRSKRTWSVSNDLLITLSELQTQDYRRTGVKPDLSQLVEEALRLLFAKRFDSA